MNEYTDEQRDYFSWLEEIADLAQQDPGNDEDREEARSRAFELADRVISYLAARPTWATNPIAEMEEEEKTLRANGFERAAVGMRVLIDRGDDEIAHLAGMN